MEVLTQTGPRVGGAIVFMDSYASIFPTLDRKAAEKSVGVGVRSPGLDDAIYYHCDNVALVFACFLYCRRRDRADTSCNMIL